MSTLLTSRKFWMALFGLLVILVAAAVPSFALDADAAAGMAVIIACYILGVTVDPGPGGWKGVILSRKFWAAVVGLVVMIIDGFGLVLPDGLGPEALISIVLLISSYIVGVASEKPRLAS